MTQDTFRSIVRELILKRDDHTCQKCGKRKPDRELVVHHLQYPAKTLSDLMLLCRGCHPVGRKMNLPEKIKRLTEVASLLDEKMRSPADIAHRYKRRYKKNIPPKIALLNLLELNAWASEGKIKVNSRVRCAPTSFGYVFWKEDKK